MIEPQITVGSGEEGDPSCTLHGVAYFPPGRRAIVQAPMRDLYTYTAYIGSHQVTVEAGDSVFWISEGGDTALVRRGPASISSPHLATVIRGYAARNKTAEIGGTTTLPYVNGCSTRQIFPPERIGDPTLQLLRIPPHSSEQVHHIHSTTRVVYVLAGGGRCVVGMDKHWVAEPLCEGMVILLHPMCPHHFETDHDPLLVLPLHVFSSPPGGLEFNHPMFNGTHRTGG